MRSRFTHEELGRTIGANIYFDLILGNRNFLDRRIKDIAMEAAQLALKDPDVVDAYNMNPVSVARVVESEVIAQTFSSNPPEEVKK